MLKVKWAIAWEEFINSRSNVVKSKDIVHKFREMWLRIAPC